jgi:hypothetical protein
MENKIVFQQSIMLWIKKLQMKKTNEWQNLALKFKAN